MLKLPHSAKTLSVASWLVIIFLRFVRAEFRIQGKRLGTVFLARHRRHASYVSRKHLATDLEMLTI